MPDRKPDDADVVPIPGQESDAERRRIRQSNDRDQQADQRGELTPHTRGYDEAADGTKPPPPDPLQE